MSLMSSIETKQADAPPPRMFKPPEWRWSQPGVVGWWVTGDWDEVLLGPEGLRLDDWRRQGRLTTVKSGPHRVVYRAELPAGGIFIKHYLVPNKRAVLRQWFRRGKGRNEGKRSRELESIGVPTITPVALGELRKRKFLFENYLVTREVAGSVALDEFVLKRLAEYPEPARTTIRRALGTQLAVMTARLHNAGLLHIDFHPGNLLVQFDRAGAPSLVMIDLDALRKTRRLGWKQARRNLAMLDHFFWVRIGPADRYRFLRTYLKHRDRRPPDARRFAREIERSTRAWAERLWRRWGARCRSTNKYFQTYRGTHCWGVASRDLDVEEMARLLENPDGPLGLEGTKLLKTSNTTTVAEASMMVRGAPTAVIFKRFNRKKWTDPLLTIFRPSRAWRSWQAGQHLASRGIPTPQNLAFIARRRTWRESPLFFLLPHETYLITAKQENAATLADFGRKVLPTLPPRRRRETIRRIALGLAALIRSLHDRSLSDRDLKASNILIDLDRLDREVSLSLIDLVGVTLKSPLPTGRKVQNLARLSLSLANILGRTRTDSLRFLRAYLRDGLSREHDWKGLWTAVDKAADSKRAQNLRRGRPLT
jgi:tRNA A-37 threonylcarbamoyl transferase component Bud32